MADTKNLQTQLHADVTVVGSGPVGLTTAALLALEGVNVILVERHHQRYNLPRAGAIDGEAMRLFQRLGIAEAVELIARPVLNYGLVTRELEVLEHISLGQDGAGWKASYLMYQPQLEDILYARVEELGVRLFMGTEVFGIEQHERDVVISTRSYQDPAGEEFTITSSYVIGCDGAGSFVRTAIGSTRKDLGFRQVGNLVVDFEQLDPDRDMPEFMDLQQIMDISRLTLLARYLGGRWSRMEFVQLDHESREFLESEKTCWKLLSPYGITPENARIVRRALYIFESTLTDHWQDRRVILVGDSAHTMPPFMGQGMCSGFRDAMNLSWKLCAVLKGKADSSLLDSYQTERASHVAQITAMASAVGEKILERDPEKARLRDEHLRSGKSSHDGLFPRLIGGIVRSPHSSCAHDAEGRVGLQARVALNGRVDRFDQFIAPGWVIVSRHRVPDSMLNEDQYKLVSLLALRMVHVSRGATAAGSFVDIDGDYDLWYQKARCKAFLVRPDNYVFGTARRMEDVPGLLDELAFALVGAGWRGIPTVYNRDTSSGGWSDAQTLNPKI